VLELRFLRGRGRDALVQRTHCSTQTVARLTEQGLTAVRSMLSEEGHPDHPPLHAGIEQVLVAMSTQWHLSTAGPFARPP
jgi:hypothetical protein